MKKGIGVLLYLVLIAAFLQFDLRLLFHFKQFVLVIFGTCLLFLSALFEERKKWEGESRQQKFKYFFNFVLHERNLIGQNALWAGILQTFILLLANMGIAGTEAGNTYMQMIALSCRPVLYGFCIWIILQDTSKEKMEDEGADEISGCDQGSQQIIGYRERLQELGLTKREIEIALLAIQNRSNAEIAEALFISEATVKKHLSNIFAKLGISKRSEIQTLLNRRV